MNKLLTLLDNVTGVVNKFMDPERRMKYRLDAAMQYVFCVEKAGRYADFPDKLIEKYKLHWRKRIFDEA